jgi:hypothetical protein
VKKEWALSQEAFDVFLAWLDPDRDRASEKYEEIRRELITDFVRRECSDPETLADEVIDRVIGKLPEIAGTYAGDPALYVYAVAKKSLQRWWLKGSEAKSLPPAKERKRQTGVKTAWRRAGHRVAEGVEFILNYYPQERLQ